MAVITPRNGDTLARVVQTALNIAGRSGVSIETGGTGNGVRVPDAHLAEIEAALGWTEAEGKTPEPATQEPTHPTTQQDAGNADAGAPDDSDPSDPEPDTTDDPDTTPEEPAVKAPAAKSATAKKTTSSRRQRRGKEG